MSTGFGKVPSISGLCWGVACLPARFWEGTWCVFKCWHLLRQTGKRSATSLDWNWNSAPHSMVKTMTGVAKHLRSVGFPGSSVCVRQKHTTDCVSVLTRLWNTSWDGKPVIWRRRRPFQGHYPSAIICSTFRVKLLLRRSPESKITPSVCSFKNTSQSLSHFFLQLLRYFIDEKI